MNQKPTKHKNLPFISDRITILIVRILRKNTIIPGLYNKNILTSKLVNNKLDKIDKMSRSGVYDLSCGDCGAFYIGQTGRSFGTRYKKHVYALKRLNKSD